MKGGDGRGWTRVTRTYFSGQKILRQKMGGPGGRGPTPHVIEIAKENRTIQNLKPKQSFWKETNELGGRNRGGDSSGATRRGASDKGGRSAA